MEENRKYTAKDFERYHAGTMSSKEMHAIEKAALEDPFLADALEGYINTSDFESDITELKDRLKEKKKNIFSISSIAQNKWWRIAALFIIIAGTGFFLYRGNFITRENSVADNEIKAIKEKKENPVPITSDSATNNDVAFERQKASQSKDRASLPKPGNPTEKENYTPDLKAQSQAAPLLNESKDEAAADNSSVVKKSETGIPKPEKEYLIKGKITDNEGKPIALASVADPTGTKVVLTDTAGKFLLNAADTSVTVTASAVGYATKNIVLYKNTKPDIQLDKSSHDLNEVAMKSSGKLNQKKEALGRTKSLSGKVAGVETNSVTIQPFAKNENFDQYLKEKIEPVYDEVHERQTGEVTLSFTVNKNGRPANVNVIKSSCKPCEKIAVQFLENGPGWKHENDKPGTVLIKF